MHYSCERKIFPYKYQITSIALELLPSSGPAASPSWPGLVLFLISRSIACMLYMQHSLLYQESRGPAQCSGQSSAPAQLDDVILNCKPLQQNMLQQKGGSRMMKSAEHNNNLWLELIPACSVLSLQCAWANSWTVVACIVCPTPPLSPGPSHNQHCS